MIIHAFTTRTQGDMKNSRANRKKAICDFFGDNREVMTMPQKHTSDIGVDALVTNRKDVALAVFAADCVPILFADGQVIAAAHAGWKGTLGGITTNTINEMKKNGSNPKEIFVWIGPHIGMCHYDVPPDRAQKYEQLFHDPKIVSFFENKWHIDIGMANYRQLIDAGITPEHIKAPITCTACQVDTYFSYRKEKDELEGEIMGVIGFL